MKPSERRKRFCQDMIVCGRSMNVLQSMLTDMRSMSVEDIKGSLINAVEGTYAGMMEKYSGGEIPEDAILEFLVFVAGSAFSFAEGGGLLECYTDFKPQDN